MKQRRKPGILIYLFALSGFAAVIAAACSSNSPAAGTGGTCSLAGNRCQLGCDGSLGCVQCVANTDCTNGAPVCVLGQCAECSVSTDCATGQVCEPATHNCAPPCATNADCMGGGGQGGNNAPNCDVTTHTCVGCTPATAAADCPAGQPLCDSRMQCSQCVVRRDCGIAAPACDAQTGTCVECLIDSDCTGQNACNAANHRCQPICVSNAGCATTPARPVCDSVGACVQCAANADCATNANNLHICNLDNHACVACAANTDCAATPATPICRLGGGGGGGGAQCVQCAANTDCAAMAATPMCDVQNGQCVQCRNDGDCAATPTTPNCNNGTCGA